MNIESFTEDRIKKSLQASKDKIKGQVDTVRVLFVPTEITEDNFEEVCDVYSRIGNKDFNSVIIVESHPREMRKKLPMPSHKVFKTPLGEVPADDRLRNELCDEDDDFFIDDEIYEKREVNLYQHLMMLQTTLEEFSLVSIQITDEDPFIVQELAAALEEILPAHNALIVFCCDLDSNYKDEFNKLHDFIKNENQSGMLNYLNSGESHIMGKGSFVAGILISQSWDLNVNFCAVESDLKTGNNLLTGYAEMQRHFILS